MLIPTKKARMKFLKWSNGNKDIEENDFTEMIFLAMKYGIYRIRPSGTIFKESELQDLNNPVLVLIGENEVIVDTDKLIKIVGIDNLRENLADLYVYASDASVHTKLPDVVVRPNSIKQVQEIAKYANKNKIPIVPRGAGSGMSGQTVPISGGIVLDMKGMNNIINIRSAACLCASK